MTDAERDELWLERVKREDEQRREDQANIQRMLEQNERIVRSLAAIEKLLEKLLAVRQ